MPARDPRPQPGLFDRIRPLTRANATPASRVAAERSEPTAAEIARRALACFVPAGAEYTPDEVAGLLGVHWIRCRPRVSQLLHVGLLRLVDPPAQRPSANGSPADVLCLTPAGLLAHHSPDPLPTPPRPSKAGNDAG